MTSWTPNAVSVIDGWNMTEELFNIFVHTNNMMFVGTQRNGLMSISLEHNTSTFSVLSKNLSSIWSVFVNSDDELYVYGTCDDCSLTETFRIDVASRITKRGAQDSNQLCCYMILFLLLDCEWYATCPRFKELIGYRNNTKDNQTNKSIGLHPIVNNIRKIYKWSANTTTNVTSMHTNETCVNIFVDINNTIYCSMAYLHKVMKAFMEANDNAFIVAAGTGMNDSRSDTLSYPWGIFVNINFELYVADFGNNRIQRFSPGKLNGTTVAGSSAPGTIDLNHPTGIALDIDDNLFIVDSGNHRIIGSGPNGFRCLVGCSKKNGSTADMLFNPTTLNFDSHGNMLVVDSGNYRIQKFRLVTNSCSK